MRNSYFGQHGGICGHELTHNFVSPSKRSQTANSIPWGEVVAVAHEDLVTDYRGHQCAEYAEAGFTSTLTSAYPTGGGKLFRVLFV
jgi:hypothetical protein